MRSVQVLLIEGDAERADHLQRSLSAGTSLPFTSDVVPSISAAISRLRGQRFDAIVVDHSAAESSAVAALDHVAPTSAIVLVTPPGQPPPIDVLSWKVQEAVARDRPDAIGGAVQLAIRRKLIQSEAIRRERRQLHGDRLAAIGQLAAGVAHEINNPAAFVMANLSVLQEHLQKVQTLAVSMRAMAKNESDAARADAIHTLLDLCSIDVVLSDARDIVEENLEGIRRIASIVRHLRTFSRIEREEVEMLNVNEVVNSACNMVHNQIRHRAQLVKELGDVPAIAADRGKLTQVLMNLLFNASHSIREGNAEGHEVRVSTATDGERVTVSVSDTGIGIPEDLQQRIFDPFFTTKPREHATGLGLSLCAEIVRQHGGFIQVTSTVGHGSRFDVVIPADTGLLPAMPVNVPAIAGGRSLRILIVDDEPFVLHAFKRILEPPHVVVTTTGAAEAIAILGQDAGFDGIICDLMMPQVDGPMFYEHIARTHPQLVERVIFCSGGAFTDRAKAFVSSIPNMVLAKPVGADVLRDAIGSVAPIDTASTIDLAGAKQGNGRNGD